MRQLDVTTAFLNAPLEEVIYMKLPPGFAAASDAVLRLWKALYGLKQANKQWHKLLCRYLVAHSWTPSDADPSLWILQNETKVLAAFYVDDCQLAAKTADAADAIVASIMAWWPCKSMGEPQEFLNIHLVRDRNAKTISAHQQPYIQRIVGKYGMTHQLPALLPLPPSVHITADGPDMGELLPDGNLYGSIVGSLMHLVVCTRPELAFCVGLLARHLKAPREAHWGAAVHVLRFVMGTSSHAITWGQGDGMGGWCDASYQKGPQNRSTTGYVFTLHGGAVSWQSKLQATTALSTCEAEYQASGAAGREAIWLCKLLPDLGYTPNTPIVIQGDNQAALALLRDRRLTSLSKHIETISWRVQQWIEAGKLKFTYVKSQENWSDVLTKALPRPAHTLCSQQLGIAPLQGLQI